MTILKGSLGLEEGKYHCYLQEAQEQESGELLTSRAHLSPSNGEQQGD